VNPLRIFGAVAAYRRGDWKYGLPDCPIDPDDEDVVDAVARGIGTTAGESRLLLASTGKHTKAKEGR
jgi:hypothetical protein